MPAGRLDAALDLSWEERVDQASFNQTQVQGAQTVGSLKQILVAVEQTPVVLDQIHVAMMQTPVVLEQNSTAPTNEVTTEALQPVPPATEESPSAAWLAYAMVQQLAEAVKHF